jgi:cytochrome c peroxidase
MEPVYAERTATGKYRTTPLRGLLLARRFFHDGSATDLSTVVDHYDQHFDLKLTPTQKADLVEYLKSL